MDGVLYQSQTVTFTCQLSGGHHEVIWFFKGHECVEGEKYQISRESDGERHMLTVNDVQSSDEGIYTFKVIDHEAPKPKVKANIVVEGQWPGNVMDDIFGKN